MGFPAEPTPHAKFWAPKAGPQSKLRTYVNADAAKVGAFAVSTAPMDVLLSLLLLIFGSASKSVETAALPGAATFARVSPPLPAVVTEPTTSVYEASLELTNCTDAAPEPPTTYTALMPRAAAAGDSGHVTEIVGCAKPELPTSTVADCSVLSHLMIERSRSGTTTSYVKTPREMLTAVPLRFKTPTLMTRESSGRLGSKSMAVVGRGVPPIDGSVSALDEALAADVPPVAAITASSAVVTPSARARRRAGADARACAAAVVAARSRSLRDGGAGYADTMMEVSGKGDTPHCVSVSAAPGTAPESAAADLADASIEGAATDISTLSGSVVVDEHGLSVGVETVSSAPATTETALLLTAAPQYVPPGVNASSGGVAMGTI